VLGERTNGRRVGEAEHYFRCKACNGWIDGRDFVWIEDDEGELPHPAQMECSRFKNPPSTRRIIPQMVDCNGTI
jgi:hypothetical protein